MNEVLKFSEEKKAEYMNSRQKEQVQKDKNKHTWSGAISNPVLLKHGVNGGAEGERWMKGCEAQQTASSSDHLHFLPVLFISISRRW